MVGSAYALKGMYAQAESTYKALDARDPTQAGRNLAFGWLYARTGRRSEAVAIARRVEANWPKTYVAPENIATVYAGLADRDRMYYWLDKGVAVRSGGAPYDAVMPWLRPYVHEARFRALMKRIGIPDEP